MESYFTDMNSEQIQTMLTSIARISYEAVTFLSGKTPVFSAQALSDLMTRNRELNSLLGQKGQAEQFYKKEAQRLQQECDALKQRLEKAVLRDRRNPGLMGFFKRAQVTVAPDAMGHATAAYQALIQELKLNLDPSAVAPLSRIEQHLKDAGTPQDLATIRTDILKLLKAYIARVIGEREEAAAFIRDISQHLATVEKRLSQTLVTAKENETADSRFTDTIEKEMRSVQQAVDDTSSLDDLKSRVVASICAIQDTIDSRRVSLAARTSQNEKEMAQLRKNLSRMKGEIEAAKTQAETLATEVLTDPLTGARNRRAYDQHVAEELKRFHRYQHTFSLVLLDVDHFKHINDTFGHAIGDLCLKQLVKRITPLLRETDFFARYGGEEFVALLPETPVDGARDVAEKIRSLIAKTEFLHKGETVRVTISLGVTQVLSSDTSATSLFERVDQALYAAKNAGRNRVVVF